MLGDKAKTKKRPEIGKLNADIRTNGSKRNNWVFRCDNVWTSGKSNKFVGNQIATHLYWKESLKVQ